MITITKHLLLIGDCTKAKQILEYPAFDLLVTSPPYFNAPFDYRELFQNYETFLEMIARFGELSFEALTIGGIVGLNIDDMLVKGIKYPIISDIIKIFSSIGYKLKGRIVWRKPEGYIRISRRSGVLLQNPYPMYYYPDNLIENILIFQKPLSLHLPSNKNIQIDDIWEITNVLPLKGRLEKDVAAFPDELPKRLIEIFSRKGSWIYDPFLGSGTTMKVAREMKRHSIGIEIVEDLIPIIRKKSGFTSGNLTSYFNVDQLTIIHLPEVDSEEEKSNISHSLDHSLLPQALKEYNSIDNNYKHHLLLLDCRNTTRNILNTNFSETLNELFPGRILVILYDSLSDSENLLTLNHLFDYVMNHGLRLRDKITVQHQPVGNWEVVTKFNSTVIFNHCYYEVLVFQKGKFIYKSKTKLEKQDCMIDRKQFQEEKWYLSLWDFRDQSRESCDSIVIARLLELFLYNDEVVGTNIMDISCLKRQFTLKYVHLI
ncbi:MAG: DNA-methyltransferase [Promethearchaeota archaeon]